ncbi:hypothetical protein SprV_0100174500 [Sparganum proliferum]
MHLWSKMRKIVRYVYQYRNDYDYFYKADDDTYMFVENLADELSRRNPDEPFMMGRRFPRFQIKGYFSGGAGYVLSRGALKLLVEKAIDIHPTCPTYDEDKEDVKMSVCGVAVGVNLYDALDNRRRIKFNWPTVYSLFLSFSCFFFFFFFFFSSSSSIIIIIIIIIIISSSSSSSSIYNYVYRLFHSDVKAGMATGAPVSS